MSELVCRKPQNTTDERNERFTWTNILYSRVGKFSIVKITVLLNSFIDSMQT